MRIVFMGTPDFAVPTMRKIASRFEVVAAYSQPDKRAGRGQKARPTPVKAAAIELGIPVFQPEKLTASSEVENLEKLAPDFIVVVAYGKILRPDILNIPKIGCINVHASLLPRWRGAAPIQWSILSGDKQTGVCTMQMVDKLDAGDIYLESATEIAATDTGATLHDRLSQMGGDLIVPTLEGLADGTITGKPQDEALVTYASKLTKEMERIDPYSKTAQQLDWQIRALTPWPGTSLETMDGERIKVHEAVLRQAHGNVGDIFTEAGHLFLGAQDGVLEIKRLQIAGKKAVDAAGFINGLKGRGIRLPLKVKPLA